MTSEKGQSNKSLIDLARLIMADERREMNFNDIFNRIADLKGLTEKQRKESIGQFYTDLNLDGHFVTTGANNWALKSLYKGNRLTKEEHPNPVRERLDIAGEFDEDVGHLSVVDKQGDFDEIDDDLYEYDDFED